MFLKPTTESRNILYREKRIFREIMKCSQNLKYKSQSYFIKVSNVDKHVNDLTKPLHKDYGSLLENKSFHYIYLGTLICSSSSLSSSSSNCTCQLSFILTRNKVSSQIPFYIFGLRIHNCFDFMDTIVEIGTLYIVL